MTNCNGGCSLWKCGRPINHPGPCQPPSSKPVGGFDLILGGLYEDFWFNAATPEHNSAICCSKCRGAVTIHRLEKLVFAFGKMTIKTCEVHTCPVCLHESLAVPPTSSKPKPATKANLVKLFAKLPKTIQQQILLTQGAK